MLTQIITDLGGASAVARALGVPDYSTVASWGRRNSIPVSYWPGLLSLAEQRGVPLDERLLVRAHVAARAPAGGAP